MMADRTQSPAYGALRPSTRRLLMFIETEIARGGGGSVTLYAGQLAVVGPVRVVLPGLSELHGLGLIEWQRFPKRHVMGLSERWRAIETPKQARIVSVVARVQRKLRLPKPSQPASVSA
jgi:hypothetical protein